MFRKSKYLVVILLSVALILAGCNGTALPIKEAMINSLDQESVEFKGDFFLELNMPENLIEQDETMKEFFSFLKNGVHLYGKQVDLQQTQMGFTPLGDQQPIRYELIVDNGTFYATSSVDQHYVKFDQFMYQDIYMQQGLDQEKMAQYQQQAIELTKDFYRNYLEEFGYKLTNATNHGTETLTLPNGDTVQAQHIQVTLDKEELYQLLVYILENATTNENVKQFINDYMELVFAVIPEDQVGTEEEKKMMKDMTVQYLFMALEQMKNELDTMTADEAFAELGIMDFVADLHYYINDKQIMKEEISFGATWTDPQSLQPTSFMFNSQFFYWNHNKELTLNLPNDSQVITYSSLQENEANLNKFNQESWLYKFLQGTLTEKVTLTFDIDDGFTKYNETQAAGVTAYINNGSTMVPFRYLGESMGADISWIADSRTAVYQLNGTEIRMQVGSKTAWVNGKPVTMNVAPEIKNDRLYIPLRFVSENLNAQVQWIPESKQAVITFMK